MKGLDKRNGDAMLPAWQFDAILRCLARSRSAGVSDCHSTSLPPGSSRAPETEMQNQKPWLSAERYFERARGIGRPLKERLRERIRVAGPDECWEWTGTRSTGGYGQIRDESGRQRQAHRLIAEEAGLDVGNMCVLHTCDNRACCNPAHFFVGSRRDNAIDRDRKGRNGLAKLTAADIIEIRKLCANGCLQREIARKFGVAKSNISLIVTRRTWQHVSQLENAL